MSGMQRWMAGVLLVALAACGPAASAGGATSGSGARASSGGARVIVEADIEGSTASTVLELVQQLRPSWLQQRSFVGGQGYPTVYLGTQPLGSVERLREVPTHNVREVRFLNGPEASSRFGARVPYGVIQVLVDIGG
ncbi:MAG TPA: hypothetical protein VE871_14450 [Longimicrobium sp.]|nr:hypothetical protein [Longimicrobium sp.]